MKSHHQDNETCPLETIFSHIQFLWHCHNSLHTRWTSKVIFCSSQISEPQTSLVALPFTKLTPYWVCSNSFATNPTWIPSILWPNSMFSTHQHQLGLIYINLVSISLFHTSNVPTASSSDSAVITRLSAYNKSHNPSPLASFPSKLT